MKTVIEKFWLVRNNIKMQVTVLGGREIRIVTPVYKRSEDIVLYFHGGDSVSFSSGKWQRLISRIQEETGATVIFPDLWSVPVLTHQEVIDFFGDLYSNFFVGLKDRKIIFIGDTAGKALAEEFAQKLRNEGVCLPCKIILLSALPDGNTTRPVIFNKLPDAVFQS